MSTKSDKNYQNQEDYSSEQEFDLNQEEGFKLPDPDMDNVTVLTENLPNNPILPWRNYDSPWQNNNHEEEDNNKEEE
jgi:hypothetical protein